MLDDADAGGELMITEPKRADAAANDAWHKREINDLVIAYRP